MTQELPNPEVYVTVEYSGFPPYADRYGLNWFTCLELTLWMEFPISETAHLESKMPATIERVAL
ncbi:hypothetical protein HTZ84_09855 [Haloterrigena sp. SYSU A558-1]|uniref:Uncharacterized protein n=1 Tax=Haloterrigena gelatinilytica TaxID=2741724 RepID=A0ABX2L8L6_9EURY|nr:hypothetical protein [Haloterrigena gelatinilytica]NUC72610.1 hypothetical protein [Haloterrigena gelatinilytica]